MLFYVNCGIIKVVQKYNLAVPRILICINFLEVLGKPPGYFLGGKKMSNVTMNILNTQVYAFLQRNSEKYLSGSGLTELALLNGFVYARIVSKRNRCIPIICEYLKANNNIICNDEHLVTLVSKVYTIINNYEREEYRKDYNDLSPLFRPCYIRHFQARMLEEEW